jgi:serine/threonine-protein kinase RsbW
MQRSFKRTLGSLEPLFEFIGDFAGRERLGDDAVFALNLAIEELFTNMVKYGGGSDEVSIDLSVCNGDLVIVMVHSGADEFDPTETADVDADQPLAERSPGGIGLHLVRKVMDSVMYEHRDGAAHLRLTKHLGGR